MMDPEKRAHGSIKGYQGHQTERELLESFFLILRDYDPDALIGWNLVGFDLRWLWRKSILKQKPGLLRLFAELANGIKLIGVGLYMLRSGELSGFKLHEYASLRRRLIQ